MKNLFYILIIIFYSCKSHDCVNPNYELINKFEHNLSIVKRAQDHSKVTKVDEYRSALLYLSNTTQIMTKADYSSTIGYKNADDFKHDMRLWKKWLKENSCLK
jgi:hypothetical protein